MEKVQIGWAMSDKWSSPPMQLIFGVIGGGGLYIAGSIYGIVSYGTQGAVCVLASLVLMMFYYNFIFLDSGPAPIDDYIIFKDPKAAKWRGRRIPMTTLYELFLDDKLEFKNDVYETLKNDAHKFVAHKCTWSLIVWLIRQLFPNSDNSSMKDKKATKKEIAEHYDRGNDFFESFLGPSFIYTGAKFHGTDQTLEQAQFNKLDLICDKLMLKDGEKFLDIGCGWGTLFRHGAKYYNAEAVGVTLSQEGWNHCEGKIKEEGLEDKASTLLCDYRDIPEGKKFNKISSIEMAEHVGLKNFPIYLKKVSDLLEDDGMFLMQVCGLRYAANWEDTLWGLFMSRYIFPGADSSTPAFWYTQQLEKAGFAVHSVENMSIHYSHTIHRWYLNFKENRPEMEKKYGGHLCRLWELFLAWSTIIGSQGSAQLYQFVVFKNTRSFDRNVFTTRDVAMNFGSSKRRSPDEQ